MVYSVNSHTNATRIGWHPWEIDLRFAPGLPPGWFVGWIAACGRQKHWGSAVLAGLCYRLGGGRISDLSAFYRLGGDRTDRDRFPPGNLWVYPRTVL